MIDIQKDTAVEGEEIEVNCTAMASKPATTIRWFKGNKELKGRVNLVCPEVLSQHWIPPEVYTCGNVRQIQHVTP